VTACRSPYRPYVPQTKSPSLRLRTLRRVRASHRVRDVQLNTDAYFKTPPICPQTSCAYYSLGANDRMASFLRLLHAHFIIPYTCSRGTRFDGTDTTVDERQSLWAKFHASAFALLSKTQLMKSRNCGWGWWPPVAETCCETAQRGPTLITTLLQATIKTIVSVWRQFHADANADSVSSTVTSPAYIENVRVAWVVCTASIMQCQMRMKCTQNSIL